MSTVNGSVNDEVLGLAKRLQDEAPTAEAKAQARAVVERLEGPLRVAIAGRVKAGKSTLLNALVGERLAPTDAGECTRIVTWYVGSHTSRVMMQPSDGPARQVPFQKTDEPLDIQLGDHGADDIEQLVLEWPSSRLDD